MSSMQAYRRTILALIISISNLLLIISWYYIDRYLSGIYFAICFILFLLSFVAIIAGIFVEFYKLTVNRNTIKQSCIVISIYAVALAMMFAPIRLMYRPSEGNIVLKGCHEGTQNFSKIKFKDDYTFEIEGGSIGFGYYSSGTYIQKGDTLKLTFTDNKLVGVGEVLVNDGKMLTSVGERPGGGRYIQFYLGDCRGLN